MVASFTEASLDSDALLGELWLISVCSLEARLALDRVAPLDRSLLARLRSLLANEPWPPASVPPSAASSWSPIPMSNPHPGSTTAPTMARTAQPTSTRRAVTSSPS
jgi:hypothetical protein